MKKIIIMILIVLSLCGCNNEKETKNILNKEYIEKIVLDKEYVIVDVRTKEEYDELHVVNAMNIPLSNINTETELDKEKIIFVYCKSGNRSNTAYKILSDLGYMVYDLGSINNISLSKESSNE